MVKIVAEEGANKATQDGQCESKAEFLGSLSAEKVAVFLVRLLRFWCRVGQFHVECPRVFEDTRGFDENNVRSLRE
jgi:hypothetical protein